MNCVFSIMMVCEVLDPWSIGKSEEEIDSKIKTYLKESYGSGKMKTVKKGSDTFMDNYTLHCFVNEKPITKENTQKVIQALREMKNKNFATNDESQFIIEVNGSKEISEAELLWEFCNIVNDDKIVENVNNVHHKQTEFLKYINETHKLLKENNFSELSKYLKENKKRIIELNSRDKMYIKLPSDFLKEEYIDKLENALNFLCDMEVISDKAISSKELNGIKKESFLEILAI